MPHASDNKISEIAFDGSIEITDAQYSEALEAIINGQEIAVRGGELRILSKDKRSVYKTVNREEKVIADNDDTPEGYTPLEPPSADHEWDGSDWIITPAKQVEIDRRNIVAEITALEALQTPRRIREAALGQDGGWLADLEDQIAALRVQLAGME
ncbi:hypothetical protein [Micavibrio aeruginosavorus]|uniref:hypothetical protein n=1 Tax=Micavibrio aeruginosavorus TaxID=349221 RepID=UPI003F4AEA78